MNLIHIDRRDVVQSCVPYVTNSPSLISIFSCSRSQALCLFVCCFSLFVLSLLCVSLNCLSLCCLCNQFSVIIVVFLFFLDVSISQFYILFFSATLSFLIRCLSLCFLFSVSLFLCLNLFLHPCRVTSLFVYTFTPKHTKKTHTKTTC